jgi:hypothetical protein
MSNLPGLLSNVTPLVRRFFTEMSKKRQQCAVINLQNNFSTFFILSLETFTVIVSNNYPKISGKIGFVIENNN